VRIVFAYISHTYVGIYIPKEHILTFLQRVRIVFAYISHTYVGIYIPKEHILTFLSLYQHLPSTCLANKIKLSTTQLLLAPKIAPADLVVTAVPAIQINRVSTCDLDAE